MRRESKDQSLGLKGSRDAERRFQTLKFRALSLERETAQMVYGFEWCKLLKFSGLIALGKKHALNPHKLCRHFYKQGLP